MRRAKEFQEFINACPLTLWSDQKTGFSFPLPEILSSLRKSPALRKVTPHTLSCLLVWGYRAGWSSKSSFNVSTGSLWFWSPHPISTIIKSYHLTHLWFHPNTGLAHPFKRLIYCTKGLSFNFSSSLSASRTAIRGWDPSWSALSSPNTLATLAM